MIIKENGDSTSSNKETKCTSTERNETNHPFHPWRRYFARVFDMAL